MTNANVSEKVVFYKYLRILSWTAIILTLIICLFHRFQKYDDGVSVGTLPAATGISMKTSSKRKAEELGAAKETNANKKPKFDEFGYLVRHNWTRAHYTHKSAKYKEGEKYATWISPVRKIEFKNRMNALAFETLRQKHDGDEVKAWIEVGSTTYYVDIFICVLLICVCL